MCVQEWRGGCRWVTIGTVLPDVDADALVDMLTATRKGRCYRVVAAA